MMQEHEEWAEAVGRKLRGAEVPAPAGGWERLCRDRRTALGARVRAPRKIWKYVAAAASILVCVSIGVRVLRIDHNVMKKRVVSVSETAVGAQRGSVGTGEVPASSLLYAERIAASASEPLPSARGVRGRALRAAGIAPEVASVPEAGEPAAAPAAADRAGADTRTEEASVLRSPQDGAADGLDDLLADALPSGRARRGGAVSLFAAGVMGNAGNAGSLSMLQRSGLPMGANALSSLDTGYDEYEFRHRQTVSFGATFRKELRRGFSVETGLNYSLLRSDVSLPGMRRDIRQRVHLVGIPLRVNWRFLQTGRFGMYLGAGGMAELCAGARFGDDRLHEKGVLWSVSALVGAQYRLSGRAALFFEPAATRYLSRMSLRTAYSDSKVALDLRLGIRFTY